MSVFRKAFLYPQSAFLSLTKTLSGDSATLFKAKIELVTTKPKTRFGKTNCFLNFLWHFLCFSFVALWVFPKSFSTHCQLFYQCHQLPWKCSKKNLKLTNAGKLRMIERQIFFLLLLSSMMVMTPTSTLSSLFLLWQSLSQPLSVPSVSLSQPSWLLYFLPQCRRGAGCRFVLFFLKKR